MLVYLLLMGEGVVEVLVIQIYQATGTIAYKK